MTRKLPPLSMLRSFEAAARHISFARAAEELHVTAAAISQQVRELERYLGQPLFLRQPHGLRLTEIGLSYLVVVRDAFDRLGSGTDELFHKRTADVVSLRVTAGFAHLWLMPRLHHFLSQEARLQIRLLTSLWTPLELDSDADFEIRCGVGFWPNLTAYELTRDDIFPVCAPQLIRKMRPPLRPEILSGQRLIHVQGFVEGWKEWFASAGDDTIHDTTRRVVFDTATLAIDLALNGGGFMMARSCFIARYLADGRLVAPFANRLKSIESFYLLERAGERLQSPARLFRDWILKEAAR